MKHVGLFIVVLVASMMATPCLWDSQLSAQWVQTNGPYGADVGCFALDSTHLFAGVYGLGVNLSTNNGTTWTQVNNGLTDTTIEALAATGPVLFAGTNGS